MGNAYAAQAKLRQFDVLLGSIVSAFDALRAEECSAEPDKHELERLDSALDALIEQARSRNEAPRRK